jgi:RNA polymerase sigma-70 factor (ECF subfamily)
MRTERDGLGEDLVPDMTRRTLLSRLRDLDDTAGWQQFFEVYWRLIYAFALRAGCSREDAEDIVQETVAAVARRMPEFQYDRSKGTFRTWLRRIVEARVNDHLRKRYRRIQTQPLEGDGAEEVPEFGGAEPAALESVWEEEWQRVRLARALERVKAAVSQRQFQIFDLYALQGQPLRRVAECFQVNAAQVYLAKHRVGRLLRAELQALESEE